MNNKENAVGFKKSIKKHGFIFHCNTRTDHFVGVGYVAIGRIPCSCYACLKKLDSTWNIRQY